MSFDHVDVLRREGSLLKEKRELYYKKIKNYFRNYLNLQKSYYLFTS